MLAEKVSSLISAAQREWLNDRLSLEFKLRILADKLGENGRPCDIFICPYAQHNDLDCQSKLEPGQCWKVFAHEREKVLMPGAYQSTLKL